MDKLINKCRIQLLDDNLVVKSDRLVDQNIEFNTGPKQKWEGPIRMEVTLTNKQDVTLLKKYIDALEGELPIKENTSRGRPASTTEKEINSPREDIYASVEVLVKEGRDQDFVINYLRGLGFVFLLTEDFLTYFPDFKFKERDTGSPNSNGQYPDSYSWMVRRVKKAKDPKSDKYDPQIIFGFRILGERDTKVVGYLYKERKSVFKAAIPSKNALTFNNTEMCKMPHYMTEEERLKWSSEMRQLVVNKEKKPSKFFLRWAVDVQVPLVTQEKLKHLELTFKK